MLLSGAVISYVYSIHTTYGVGTPDMVQWYREEFVPSYFSQCMRQRLPKSGNIDSRVYRGLTRPFGAQQFVLKFGKILVAQRKKP